jgi:hypothetical protein
MPTISADGIYYVDLGADPDFADGSFISIYPESIQFDDQIGNADQNGVGNISFQISFSARDQDGAIVVSDHDFIGPMRSYFRLRYGNIAIMAGPITRVGTMLGSDFMSVTGKTWEHYMERWQYPYDGRDVHVNDFVQTPTYINDELIASGGATPTGLAYQALNRDVIRIFSDIISVTMNSVPHRQIFNLSKLATLSGIKHDYFSYSLGDSSFMDSFVQGLAGTGEGFDWWISWNKKIYWATPNRYGNPGAPSLVYTFDDAHLPESLEFNNNGPQATHVTGRGAGLAVQTTITRAFGYDPAQVQFTRIDASVDLGDVRSNTDMINKTQRKLSRYLQPEHEIPLTVDPSSISNFWSTFRKGRAVYVDVDLIAHHIDSAQQLVGYKASMNEDSGDVLVDFILSQVYDLSYNAGSPEG